MKLAMSVAVTDMLPAGATAELTYSNVCGRYAPFSYLYPVDICASRRSCAGPAHHLVMKTAGRWSAGRSVWHNLCRMGDGDGRVARSFDFAPTDPSVQVSRTRLLEKVTRLRRQERPASE